MKLEFAKSVKEQVDLMIENAESEERTIARIRLSKSEYIALCCDLDKRVDEEVLEGVKLTKYRGYFLKIE